MDIWHNGCATAWHICIPGGSASVWVPAPLVISDSCCCTSSVGASGCLSWVPRRPGFSSRILASARPRHGHCKIWKLSHQTGDTYLCIHLSLSFSLSHSLLLKIKKKKILFLARRTNRVRKNLDYIVIKSLCSSTDLFERQRWGETEIIHPLCTLLKATMARPGPDQAKPMNWELCPVLVRV